jgi:formate dehydrogenase assembly factor FdhD
MNIDDLPGAGPACVPMDVRRVQAESVEAAQDHVAEETPIALVYNGQPFAVMLGTPLDLEDFALGFTWTEGIIASLEEFHGVEVEAEETGFSVYVSVPHERVEAPAAACAAGRCWRMRCAPWPPWPGRSRWQRTRWRVLTRASLPARPSMR